MKIIHKNYTGVIVPMITPFKKELMVDIKAVENILNAFVKADVSPFVLGTTGESVSISEPQKALLVKSTVEFVNKRVKTYAGISGNCLSESIENAKLYAGLGIDAVVAHLPFYYPLSSSQMLRYYEQLADSIPCPLILYNNPITTKQSIPLEVIDQLSHHRNITGIKDSERGMERLDKSIKLWSDRTDFSHLVGWAAQSTYSLLKGSDGIVPSTGNLIPKMYSDLYKAAIIGDSEKANELQEKADKISEVYQKDKNLSQSIPALKIMMSEYKLCQSYVLPPMYELDKSEQKTIKEKTLEIIAASCCKELASN
jgi:dihydrodipicolinate synthase/N-acetylneuraminate lyase